MALTVTEFCVRTVSHAPRNPGQTWRFTGIRRRISMLREVVDRKCVGEFRCALARANGINFQACSIDHSDISPFRINDLRAALNSLSQNPPQFVLFRDVILHSTVCGHAETERRRNCVRPLNVPRSLTAILLVGERRSWALADTVAKKIDVFANAVQHWRHSLRECSSGGARPDSRWRRLTRQSI